MELLKISPAGLRSLGLDERWLQQKIQDDPKILGLGDLEIAGREHRQAVGGRLDFLMRAPEEDVFYEVELMLGAVDESHIIRTIEYWDLERQRRPNYEHRAVIVAEEITARFFNVLRLLNRAVPLIAVKLSAFVVDGKVVLHPVTVLNIVEEGGDPYTADPVERVDRSYWEKKSSWTLAMVDKLFASLRETSPEARLTYNRHHIAIGSTGRNFCWFHERKAIDTCHVVLRASPDARDAILDSLLKDGVDATAGDAEWIKLGITKSSLEQHFTAISKALSDAELASH